MFNFRFQYIRAPIKYYNTVYSTVAMSVPDSLFSGCECRCVARTSRRIVRMMKTTALVFLFLTMFLFKDVICFNVDTRTATIHTGDRGSMFGFAVAQHVDQQTSWLLIGAPRAQTRQSEIKRAGAVFRCSVERSNDCQQIPFDTKGNNIWWNGSHFLDIESKSNQWFGATVHSCGKNGVIVACAPLHVYFSNSLNMREPVGVCYAAQASSTHFKEFSPCRNANWGYHRQGYCQAGFSATLSEDGTRLLMGAVGSFYWQGQVFKYRVDDPSQKVQETAERAETEDNSYMGYSSAAGEFNGDDEEDFVVGAPRGHDLLGKVILLRQNMSIIMEIFGEQIGSYFGHSLAVADLNGDRRDDIIVGAPLLSEYKSADMFETGRVYVFYQTYKNTFDNMRRDIMDGTYSRGRFGLAVSKLGDINYDGYNDMAVSAPYGGKDGRGVIYIYHGSSKGIITQVSQEVYAKEVDKKLTTFGYSLSGGYDLDRNYYPDLLVGSYKVDKAIFLKARPVVRVAARLRILQQVINLDDKSCSMINGTEVICLTFETNLEYQGIGVPEELYFDLQWELDTLLNEKRRAFYLVRESSTTHSDTLKLRHKKPEKVTSYAFVMTAPRDKLTPIVIDFKFKLYKSMQKKRKKEILPVLDQYIPKTLKTQVQILKHCGPDNICIPDLRIELDALNETYIVGRRGNLILTIKVDNRGEDAFESELYLVLPAGVTYYNIIEGKRTPVFISCNEMAVDDQALVYCDIGNPLPAKKRLEFKLVLTPQDVDGSNAFLKFDFHVNSSNPEVFVNTTDNHASLTIAVTAKSKLIISGVSIPEQIVYNRTNEPKQWKKTGGPVVIHLYEIRNKGPTNIEEMQVEILWPSYVGRGDALLHIIQPPKITQANGKCEIVEITPKLNLTYSGVIVAEVELILRDEKKRSVPERHKRDYTHPIVLTCTERWCTVIICKLMNMNARSSGALIEITSRLSTKTLRSHGYKDQLQVMSFVSTKITKMPYNLTLTMNLFGKTVYNVSTLIHPISDAPPPKSVEWWIIAVAVSAGLLLLLLLTMLLWWIGFFKRKRLNEKTPEKQPLNSQRNGTPRKLDIDGKRWE